MRFDALTIAGILLAVLGGGFLIVTAMLQSRTESQREKDSRRLW